MDNLGYTDFRSWFDSLKDPHMTLFDEAFAAGAALERARIVAWLREAAVASLQVSDTRRGSPAVLEANTLNHVADRLESGERPSWTCGAGRGRG